jgi:hypothetical protein
MSSPPDWQPPAPLARLKLPGLKCKAQPECGAFGFLLQQKLNPHVLKSGGKIGLRSRNRQVLTKLQDLTPEANGRKLGSSANPRLALFRSFSLAATFCRGRRSRSPWIISDVVVSSDFVKQEFEKIDIVALRQ